MNIGVLSFDFPPCLRVTWKIPEFFKLATEAGYSLQSPVFPFADRPYCLRLSHNRNCDEIEVLNLTDTNAGGAVLYEVQFKSETEEMDMSRYVRDNKVIFWFPRQRLNCERDLYVPDGTLTVLCSVRTRKSSSAGTPESGEAQTGVIPQNRMSGKLSYESPPFLYVTWRIPGFFQLSREFDYARVSPEFPFAGHCFRLRLLSSGGRVDIQLMNLTDPVPGRYASYEVGLTSTSGEEIHICRSGTSTTRYFYISRSYLDEKETECFLDGHLTVFCYMGSSEPSSGGSPKSVGVQTSNKEQDKKGLPETTNSVSCAIQTEIPESVSCAIQTEVPESLTDQKHSQDEKVSSLDTEGLAKSQYDYKFFLQAA